MKTSSLFLFLLFSVMGVFAGPTEDMFDAIKNGNFDKFKAAIAAGADVNAHNAIGNTPLMDALTDIDMVKELIAAKADVNKYNAGKTHNPLSIACTFAMNEAALALLDAGANVNLADAVMGCTPLGWAIVGGASKEVVDKLVANGANKNHVSNAGQDILSMLLTMSMSSDLKVVKFKEIGAMRDKMGYKPSPIFNNCVASNFTTLEERIDMALGLLGFTIDQERMINLPLTVVGADELNKTAKKYNLMTWPLYEATMNQADRSGMFKALLARGADPNKTFGNTAFGLNRPVLHWLALRPNYLSPADDMEVVKLLVGAGAKIDFVDGTGYTSLILAAKTGNVNFVKALLKHAPDLNILQKDVEHEYFGSYLGGGLTVKKTWRTARDWAAEMKQTEIFNLIKAAGGKGAKEIKS